MNFSLVNDIKTLQRWISLGYQSNHINKILVEVQSLNRTLNVLFWLQLSQTPFCQVQLFTGLITIVFYISFKTIAKKKCLQRQKNGMKSFLHVRVNPNPPANRIHVHVRIVLTLLFTFQFNHLQHHDSSVVYILNAYDLSVHSSIGCTCKMYVRTSVVITFALQPSYTDKHIFFFTFVRFTNICECVSAIQVYISCI